MTMLAKSVNRRDKRKKRKLQTNYPSLCFNLPLKHSLHSLPLWHSCLSVFTPLLLLLFFYHGVYSEAFRFKLAPRLCSSVKTTVKKCDMCPFHHFRQEWNHWDASTFVLEVPQKLLAVFYHNITASPSQQQHASHSNSPLSELTVQVSAPHQASLSLLVSGQ